MQSLPSFLEIHPSQPHTDSTRRYQDDTMSLRPELHYSLNDRWKKSKMWDKRVCWWYNRGSTWEQVYQSPTHTHVFMDLPSLITIVRGVNFDLPYKLKVSKQHDNFECSNPAHSRTCWQTVLYVGLGESFFVLFISLIFGQRFSSWNTSVRVKQSIRSWSHHIFDSVQPGPESAAGMRFEMGKTALLIIFLLWQRTCVGILVALLWMRYVIDSNSLSNSSASLLLQMHSHINIYHIGLYETSIIYTEVSCHNHKERGYRQEGEHVGWGRFTT